MTRIDFHTHVGDRLGYACRLTRKAYAAGKPVLVLADADELASLNAALWTFAALEFIPHCLASDTLAAVTPVLLSDDPNQASQDAHHAVLLNMRSEVPPNFARFERLLELVGDSPEALDAGRERYRFYRDRGYQLSSHKQG